MGDGVNDRFVWSEPGGTMVCRGDMGEAFRCFC